MLPLIIASGWKKVHSHIEYVFVFKGVFNNQYNIYNCRVQHNIY